MATRTTQLLDDDLDGGPADETVPFDLDGVSYTIDLSAANAAKLRAAIGPFLRAATRTHRRTDPYRFGRARSTTRKTAIREWARSTGFEVSDRGRIRQAVLDAYHAAGQPGAGVPTDGSPARPQRHGRTETPAQSAGQHHHRRRAAVHQRRATSAGTAGQRRGNDGDVTAPEPPPIARPISRRTRG